MRAALDAAVGQDRRLLPRTAAIARRRRATTPAWKSEASCWSTDEVLAAAAAKDGRQPLLHGRGLARAEGQGRREGGEMIRAVKALGLETCVTLGMLKEGQAQTLKAAGLDYYNHNLDTAPEFYGEIVTTHDPGPLRHARASARGRHQASAAAASSAWARREASAPPAAELANMPPPESVPINRWCRCRARRWQRRRRSIRFEFVRTIAVARITMPKSRCACPPAASQMSDELQALCFLAGANSIFYGDKLLTTGNPDRPRRSRPVRAPGSDIGCATGDGIRAFAGALPARPPLAVDYAPAMLAEVRAGVLLAGTPARTRAALLNG
jgi:biotin synthase